MNVKHYFYWIDALRGLAALLVLLVHTRSVLFESYSLLSPESQNIYTKLLFALMSNGSIGVVIFFVLTGFLVGGGSINRVITNDFSSKEYVISRITRIGIPLFFASLFSFFSNRIVGNPVSIPQMLANCVGLNGIIASSINGVFWTLTYQIWFYIGLLGVLLICRNRNNQYLYGCILLILSLCVNIKLGIAWTIVILSGIISYRLKGTKLPTCIIVLSILLFFISIKLYDLCAPSKWRNYQQFSLIDRDALLVISGFALSIFVSQIVNIKPCKTFFVTLDKVLSSLSKFSYSLFLIHYPVLMLICHFVGKQSNINASTLIYMVGCMGLCILVSYLFYLLIERNCGKVKIFLISKFVS